MSDSQEGKAGRGFPFVPGSGKNSPIAPVRLKDSGEAPAPPTTNPSRELPKIRNSGVVALPRMPRTGTPAKPLADDDRAIPEFPGSSGVISSKVPVALRASSEYVKIADSDISLREERISVSFPGLMKVLAPEKSFLPITLAVRVTNLSISGALVEVHERSANIDKTFIQPNRFFELKIAHHEMPDLRGTIAWTDFSGQLPHIGLSCFERIPEVADVVRAGETKINFEGPPPLPTPVIDPLPPISHERQIRISGTAPEAIEVIIKRDDVRFAAKVKDERFYIDLELDPSGDNEFSVRSVAGQRKSHAVPVRIDYAAGTRGGGKFRFNTVHDRDKTGKSETVFLDFKGNVRQAERVLFRFSQLMSMSEKVRLTATLTSGGKFDDRLYNALKLESSLLSEDSTGNPHASQLLDELL